MLGAGPGDADDVDLLEGVIADQSPRHLAGQHHQGDRVAIGGGNAGDPVGGAGAGGQKGDADSAGGPGKAVGCMHRALFVAYQDMADTALAEFVIELNNRTAGIPKQEFHALFLQTFDDCL
jgi:hypothetical protein